MTRMLHSSKGSFLKWQTETIICKTVKIEGATNFQKWTVVDFLNGKGCHSDGV